MPRSTFVELAPFECHGCGRTLGFTAPGEAKRINLRAHVFCEACRDEPAGLTDRMQELLDFLNGMRERGERPTLSAAAEFLGVSRSRAQQLAMAIRARGEGEALNRALGKAA